MATERRPFTQEEIDHAWREAKEVPGFDATKVRKDYAGAWIKYDEYGKQNTFGWEVDHQHPLALDGTYDLRNLVALHWKNNRTKDDNYPGWETSISSEGNKNIEKIQKWSCGKKH